MKQVIIDRGIYKLGRKGVTEPKWESTEEGCSIVIGCEGEEFSIAAKEDIYFLLVELSKKLGLDFISKVVKDDFGTNEEYYKCSRCNEVFEVQGEELPEDLDTKQFCYNCGAVLDWDDVLEEGEE